jgi:hypothetical protein
MKIYFFFVFVFDVIFVINYFFLFFLSLFFLCFREDEFEGETGEQEEVTIDIQIANIFYEAEGKQITKYKTSITNITTKSIINANK